MKSPLSISESPLQNKKLSKEEKEKLIVQKWAKLGINSIFRKTTVIRLEDFYKKYGLKYSFNGLTLANNFSIKPNSAYKLIKKCVKLGIIRKEKRGIYYFEDLLK